MPCKKDENGEKLRVRELLKIIEDKKGEKTRILDMRDHTLATSFFILANGTSPKHVKAIAEELEEEYEKKPLKTEGMDTGSWAVLDYGEIMVHIFNEQVRLFYNLDDLWIDRDFPLENIEKN